MPELKFNWKNFGEKIEKKFWEAIFLGEASGCRRLVAHSRMGHFFFSYLLNWEVDLIEILDIMPQMWQYVIFLSLKQTKVTSDFILN